MVVERFRTIN